MKQHSVNTISKSQYSGRSSAEVEAIFVKAYSIARRASGVWARAAVASGAVAEGDGEDLEQEGLIASWRALRLFDPSRASLRTFIERVVAARMRSLHRARICRPSFRPIRDNEHYVGPSWARGIELRSDVRRLLSALSDTDRCLALALIEYTPTEVARLFGVARSTVYERIRHIRSAFAKAGLCPHRARGGDGRRPKHGTEEAR